MCEVEGCSRINMWLYSHAKVLMMEKERKGYHMKTGTKHKGTPKLRFWVGNMNKYLRKTLRLL